MSAYEGELRRRLLSRDVRATAKWFIDMIARQKVLSPDFSELEREFWLYILDNYERYMREQVRHSDMAWKNRGKSA